MEVYGSDGVEYSGKTLAKAKAFEADPVSGTASNPAYRRIDGDVETGKVRGLS